MSAAGHLLSAIERLLAVEAGPCERRGSDLAVSNLVLDSRQVVPGCLFAALPGSRQDGRAFVPAALAAGAAALLLPAGSEVPPGVPALLCAQPRRAAGLIAQRLAGDPARRLPCSASPARTARPARRCSCKR